ncbi:MAG: toll/interleukin-1 receptor domain-containing protein [Zoogloeaceae bacterium]|nr:toll/interleukin-1 receptor domain-containing protein [Zoogloeaceae bacterium]
MDWMISARSAVERSAGTTANVIKGWAVKIPMGATMKIFISHFSEDKAIVDALIRLLKDTVTRRTDEIKCSSSYSSKQGIPAGVPWFQWIEDEITSCSVALVVLTKRSHSRPWVFWEFGAAYIAAVYKLRDKIKLQDKGAERCEELWRNTIPVAIGIDASALSGPYAPVTATDLTTEEGVYSLIEQIEKINEINQSGTTRSSSSKRRSNTALAVKTYLGDLRCHLQDLERKYKEDAVRQWLSTASDWFENDIKQFRSALQQLLQSPCNEALSMMVRDLRLLSQETILSLNRYLKVKNHSELPIPVKCRDEQELRVAFEELVSQALINSNFFETIEEALGVSSFGAYVYAIGKLSSQGNPRKYLASCLAVPGHPLPALIALIGGGEQAKKWIEQNIEQSMEEKNAKFGHLLISQWATIPFAIVLEFKEAGEWSGLPHWSKPNGKETHPLLYSVCASADESSMKPALNHAFGGAVSQQMLEAFDLLRTGLVAKPEDFNLATTGHELDKPMEQYMATKIKGGLLLPIFGEPKITLLILTQNPIDISGAQAVDPESPGKPKFRSLKVRSAVSGRDASCRINGLAETPERFHENAVVSRIPTYGF